MGNVAMVWVLERGRALSVKLLSNGRSNGNHFWCHVNNATSAALDNSPSRLAECTRPPQAKSSGTKVMAFNTDINFASSTLIGSGE